MENILIFFNDFCIALPNCEFLFSSLDSEDTKENRNCTTGMRLSSVVFCLSLCKHPLCMGPLCMGPVYLWSRACTMHSMQAQGRYHWILKILQNNFARTSQGHAAGMNAATKPCQALSGSVVVCLVEIFSGYKPLW